MKTIHLEINESIFDKVMLFLNNLPKKDVKLSVENDDKHVSDQLKSISLKTKDFKFNRNEANER